MDLISMPSRAERLQVVRSAPCPYSKLHAVLIRHSLRYQSCLLVHLAHILLSRFSLIRDLRDIDDPNPEVQQDLAKQIRDACIHVGFFYGAHITRLEDKSSTKPHSKEPWHLRRDYWSYS